MFSAILCFYQIQKRKQAEREVKNGFHPGRPRDYADLSLHQDFPGCYVQLDAILRLVTKLYVHPMCRW
jgi:hypothetical protein